jgi:hypothetical protein
MRTKATAEQVRKHYRDQGYRVEIDERGVVTLHHSGAQGASHYNERLGAWEWLEYTHVSEYSIDDSGNVVWAW